MRLALALTFLGGCAGSAPPAPVTSSDARVLVFTATAGWRHAAIPDAVEAVRQLGEVDGFRVDHTEDPARFTDDHLAGYAAVVFLLTSGDVLGAEQEAAFERYVRAGGGYAGIHSASDTEYDWPFYGDLVGAYFDRHPPVQTGQIDVVGRHPSTAPLSERWEWTDEWYAFRERPQGVHVLMTVDESTYDGGTMGADHPIAWCHEALGGRAWYTALGHRADGYADAAFRAHLSGGIRYAAGLAEADCSTR